MNETLCDKFKLLSSFRIRASMHETVQDKKEIILSRIKYHKYIYYSLKLTLCWVERRFVEMMVTKIELELN